MASGLAAHIRSSTESDTFDLAGQSVSTVTVNIEQAFNELFPLEEMIRITFITGAGKLGRQKYDDGCAKAVTSTLRKLGFEEDRAASCVRECGGSFKMQHDTGKNLKTVVVFPKIDTSSSNDKKGEGGDASSQSSLLPPDSLEYKIAVSTIPLFTNMMKAKFPSWSQKRSLLMLVDTRLIEPLDELDVLLMRGGLLSSAESNFYEQCISISDKKCLIKEAMSRQVLDEKLTASEVDFLLSQVTVRVDELQLEKRTNMPTALQEREAKLRRIAKNPLPPFPLKHQTALGKLWKQAAPLIYLKQCAGKILPPSEAKKLGQLQDILNEISNLEKSSRGLLEDDESYEERIQTYRRDLQQKYSQLGLGYGNDKKGRGRGGDGGGGASSLSGKHITGNVTSISAHTPHIGGRGGGWMSAKDKKALVMKRKKGRFNKGGLFGAMMADSDSNDSDEEEDDDEGNRDVAASNSEISNCGKINNASKKKKKRKNKKKNKNNHGYDDNDDAFLDAAVATNAKEAAKVKNKETLTSTIKVEDAVDGSSNIITLILSVLSLILSVLSQYIIPMILAVLTWLVTVLFGNKSKKKNKLT
mmetsp:Transcript_17715/g.20066  ORF Transcript_17715/g.20066 Transcript_17715/m.20066 type:complete len:585 (-) Transcript_17715:165-1919(-)